MTTPQVDEAAGDAQSITGPQLRALALQVREYQDQLGLSDTALCKKFSALGSTKTFNRILASDFEQMDIERQAANLETVLALIAAERAAGKIDEPDFDDLAHVRAARSAIMEAMQETGNNRLVLIEGASGSGKTTVQRMMAARWPGLIQAEADETWSSFRNMMGDLLIAMNPINRDKESNPVPYHLNAQKDKIITFLKARKRPLSIDEGHHICIQGLNFLKTILNQTPTVLIIYAIPVLLRRLEKEAYEECRQLLRNRLCERVHLNGPPKKEALLFLERRGVQFDDPKTAAAAVETLCATATSYGNWNFVNLVARRCRREMAGRPLDLEQYLAAQKAVIATR